MLIAAVICLLAMMLMVTISTHKDRPKFIFIVGTVVTAAIISAIESGNGWSGWLLIPLVFFCLPAVPAVFRKDRDNTEENSPSAEDAKHRGSNGKRHFAQNVLPALIAFVVLLGGMLVIRMMFDGLPTALSLLLAVAWPALVFFALYRFGQSSSQHR